MLSNKLVTCIETHTEGMPTRIITGGVSPLKGSTMSKRRQYALDHLLSMRQLIMREPRGHAGMFGAILSEPTQPDADFGVLFINSKHIIPMCGHGTIGVATALVETGMVQVTEPVTRIRLDTPAGIVVAQVRIENGRASTVTFENVPALVLAQDQSIDVPGVGHVKYDLVWGGNFYAVVNASSLGLKVDLSLKDALIQNGVKIMGQINETAPPVHPLDESIRGLTAVQFVDPAGAGADARNVVISQSGYFDRSPCGTGTSALMVLRYSQGTLKLGQPFVNQSILGRCFTGQLLRTATVAGHQAVIPEISGRAWITGLSQYMLDPTDPFPTGLVV